MAEDLVIQVQIDSRPAQVGRDAVIRTLAEIKAAVDATTVTMGAMGKTGASAFEQMRVSAEKQMATLSKNRREYELLQGALQGVSTKQLEYIRGVHNATEAIRLEQKAVKDLNEEKKRQQGYQETRDMHMQNQRWADETGKSTGGVMPMVAPRTSAFATLGMPDPEEFKTRSAALKSSMGELNEMYRTGAINLTQLEHGQKNYNNELNKLAGVANIVERSALHRVLAGVASATFVMGGAAAGVTALGAALGAPVISGMKHLKHMEELALSMRAVIRSITELSEDEAKAVTQNMTAQLQEQALKYSLNLDDLVSAARVALGPGINADMGFDEIVRIATLATSAVKHLGLDSRQVIQETRALMTGSGNAASATLRTMMSITKKEMEEAQKSAGGVIGFLEERMKGFMETAPEMATTMTGLMEGIGIKTTRLFADPKMFNEIKEALTGLSNAIGTLKDGKFVFTPEALGFANGFLETVRFIGTGLGAVVKTAFEFRTELGLATAAWVAFKVGSNVIPLVVTGFGNLVEIGKALVAMPAALSAATTEAGSISGGVSKALDAFKTKAQGLSVGTMGGIIGVAIFGGYTLAKYTGLIDAIFDKVDDRSKSVIEASKAARQRGADATTAAQGGPNAIERRDLQQRIGDLALENAGIMKRLSTTGGTTIEPESGLVAGDILRDRLRKKESERLLLQEELAKQNKASGTKEMSALDVLLEARTRALAKFNEDLESKVTNSIQKAAARRGIAETEASYNFAVNAIKKGQVPIKPLRYMEGGAGNNFLEGGVNEAGPQLGGRARTAMGNPITSDDVAAYNEWLETTKEITTETVKQETAVISLRQQMNLTAQQYVKNMGDANDLVANITTKTLSALEDGLVNAFKGGKFEAKDFFKEISDMILRMVIQQTMIKPIASLLGDAGSGFDWKDALIKAFGGMAVGAASGGSSGAVSDGSGGSNYYSGVEVRAVGGEVKRGRSYIVGEAGPELFSPGATGFITPNSALQTPKSVNSSVYAPVMNYAPQIDARGSDAGVQQRIDVAMEKAKVGAFKMVQSSFERGGTMHKAAR